jgi:hypothetical protein
LKKVPKVLKLHRPTALTIRAERIYIMAAARGSNSCAAACRSTLHQA